ncbi:hypothetical protein [Alteribacillus sp. HJP-4]|uniref:hypothetical protein n=1 Tax=Alteribacillus sp. HJP-4 TaxID=2775394 RepID=UPI0035CD36BC
MNIIMYLLLAAAGCIVPFFIYFNFFSKQHKLIDLSIVSYKILQDNVQASDDDIYVKAILTNTGDDIIIISLELHNEKLKEPVKLIEESIHLRNEESTMKELTKKINSDDAELLIHTPSTLNVFDNHGNRQTINLKAAAS